jgi:hypothetical protein
MAVSSAIQDWLTSSKPCDASEEIDAFNNVSLILVYCGILAV